MGLTRRLFLERLGATAGASVTYDAMTALGLLPIPEPSRGVFELRGAGNRTPVMIVGAGLAGLATAYELTKLGYDCRVLEGRMRPGGRCHTIRRGTVSEEDGSTEVAAFDDGLYYNPGPMRIPHHHQTTLAYCRELGVEIEVFVNDNEAAFVYQHRGGLSGKRLRRREVRSDLSGYTAELLSKAISAQALDAPLSEADREALLNYLQRAGALNDSGAYTGSSRRGYSVPPGAGTATGTASPPLPLSELLQSGAGLQVQSDYMTQATMFQVSGGSDRLAAAFASRLGSRVVYGAEVRELRQHADGVAVVYARQGRLHLATAAYGVCALPLSIAAALPVVHIDPALKSALASIPYSSSSKIGLQFSRRFWEEDDGIFGGVSRTDQELAQIVYPSTGFLTRKGVLIGYYQNGRNAAATGLRSPRDRVEFALAQGERLHPPYRQAFETAFSVSWQNVKWNRGGWAQFSTDARRTVYPRLLEPDGRYYFAGDHVSYLSGWMAGALESGQRVSEAIHARATRERRATI